MDDASLEHLERDRKANVVAGWNGDIPFELRMQTPVKEGKGVVSRFGEIQDHLVQDCCEEEQEEHEEHEERKQRIGLEGGDCDVGALMRSEWSFADLITVA